MKSDWHEIIQRYVLGDLDEEGVEALQTALSNEPEVFALFLDYMNLEVALEVQAETREVTRTLLLSPALAGSGSARGRSWMPSTSAVAGLVLGLVCASFGWAAALPWLAEARQTVRSIFSEGFETESARTVPGLPVVTGRWSGDETDWVSGGSGVRPKSGARMLRFLSGTYAGENSPRSQWGDVYRLIDLRGVMGLVRGSVRVSASFLGLEGSAGERFACSVEAFVLDGEVPGDVGSLDLLWLRQNSSASGSRRHLLGGGAQWQEVSVEVPVTDRASRLMLHLSVIQEYPVIRSGAVRFPGHYMDDVRVELVSGR